MDKIFIVGCAKTGTTLLRRLFNAFDGLEVNQKEQSLYDFVSSKYNVAKRRKRELLSSVYEDGIVWGEMKTSTDNGIKFVLMTRNREDTLKSTNGYVEPERYDGVKRQADMFSDMIASTVSYEELISDPDKVQERLAEELGLTIKHKFSDYPNFIDSTNDDLNHGQYRLRKIGEKK